MTQFAVTELLLNKSFDSQTCRHKLEGETVVLHCHHFTSLYTQIADDCGMLDAKALLAECSEDTWGGFLSRYFSTHGVTDTAARISLGEQIYAAVGLGKMEVKCIGPESGEVVLKHSHVDDGWIKKWGKRKEPVNFITAGYIAGMFSAILDRPARSFTVMEAKSIVRGDPFSMFTVAAKL
jgi:hypothetical protein